MRDDEFDDMIRKELDGYQPDIPKMDWEMMKSSIDQQGVLDEEFDDMVKSKVTSYTSDLKTDNWIALRGEILRNKELRLHILRMKALEFAMALFFLIFLSTLFNINSSNHKSQLLYSKKISELNRSRDKVKRAYTSNKTTIDSSLQKANSVKKGYNSSVDTISTDAPPHLVVDEKDLFASYPIILSGATTSNIYHSSYREGRKDKNVSEELNNDAVFIDRLPVQLSIPRSNQNIESLANIVDVLTAENESDKSEKNYFVSLSAGPRKNIIASPFDPVYRTSAYSAISTNYEINFKIGISHNRLDYYTGASYILQEYQPKRVNELVDISTSRYVQSLSNNQFKTLSIPLGINYHFIKRRNYTFYASVASEGNLVLASSYKVKIDVYNNDNRSFTSSRAIENSLLESKNFDKGYSNGGDFRDNLYISSSVGLGYTYKFSNFFSLLAEGRYQHTIITSGIGPNEDRFHGASLNIGLTCQF